MPHNDEFYVYIYIYVCILANVYNCTHSSVSFPVASLAAGDDLAFRFSFHLAPRSGGPSRNDHRSLYILVEVNKKTEGREEGAQFSAEGGGA